MIGVAMYCIRLSCCDRNKLNHESIDKLTWLFIIVDITVLLHFAPRVRKYDAAYIKYGFVAVEKSAIELSQCVVCLDTLSSDALWLTRRDCSSICITA
ncbi:hypothetical protein T4D_2972 [Trichinella pseudospiralis]|uniref:Uncharacterized protein n=1 Tax=Trichinella pseudospiralis TaxID=6337 RepID=A0A0V1FX29_TRIPS|nr:hypothetical protein T4D_2972 [Trichinella pseudospiralis]